MLRHIKNKRLTIISALCLLLVLGMGLILHPHKGYATGYSLVATDSYAAAQPTFFGQIIWALQPYNNKLYVGFGDYGNNTGPIAIAPYDPNSATFSLEWTASTEEIDNYEVINGKLFATATDPRGADDFSEGLPWADHSPIGAEHVFGLTTLNGTDLWMAGSGGANDLHAMLWHSTDGGTTWQVALDMPPTGATGDFVRFYFVGAYNGKIYVEPDHDYNYSEVWNGSSWSQGPDFTDGWKAETFAGKMVMINEEITRDGFKWFDGTTITAPAEFDNVNDYTISGNYLYTVSSDCTIQRTQDLVTWQTVGIGCPSSTNTPYSIGVLNGYVYVGTTGSQIYRLQIPAMKTGDLNADGSVNAADLAILEGDWGTNSATSDLNGNGTVDIYDLSILLSNFGS